MDSWGTITEEDIKDLGRDPPIGKDDPSRKDPEEIWRGYFHHNTTVDNEDDRDIGRSKDGQQQTQWNREESPRKTKTT